MKLRISVEKFLDGRLAEEESSGDPDNLKEFIGDGFIETVTKNPSAIFTMTLKEVYSLYYCVHLDLEGQRVVYPDGTVGGIPEGVRTQAAHVLLLQAEARHVIAQLHFCTLEGELVKMTSSVT